MDLNIALEDLQALTLLAQDPQGKELNTFKSQLSSEVAKQIAEAIVRQTDTEEPIDSSPIEQTAKAIRDWVDRNRASARPGFRPQNRGGQQAARDWVTQHASAWKA